MSGNLFEGVGAQEYEGVWGAWKWGSLALFAVFVVAFIDGVRSLRMIARR